MTGSLRHCPEKCKRQRTAGNHSWDFSKIAETWPPKKQETRKEITELHQIKLWGILASHHHLIQSLYLVHNITDEVINACYECIQNCICDHDRSLQTSIGSEKQCSQHVSLKVTDKTSWCFLYVCVICTCLVLAVSSSSWCLGWVAVCDCGTPWTFPLPFFSSTGKLSTFD